MQVVRRERERVAPNAAALCQPFAFSFFLMQQNNTVYPRLKCVQVQ